MDLYGSPHDYIIHAALFATLCVSLITSFQSPLEGTGHAAMIELSQRVFGMVR